MAYPLEKRELVAEAPGLRMQILTLGPGQEVPWHWHSEVTDTFWCMDGPMVIETRAPRAAAWDASGRADRRSMSSRTSPWAAGSSPPLTPLIPLHHPA